MGLNDDINKIRKPAPPPTAEESLNDINSKVSIKTEQIVTNDLIQEQIDNSPLTDAELRDTPVPISGTVTANIDKSGLATDTLQTTGNTSLSNIDTNLGAKADAAATTDTGTFSLISFFKRLLQKQTTISATQTDGTQRTKVYQDGADVSKNNGAWMKFSNDQITKSASGALLGKTKILTLVLMVPNLIN